MHARTQLLNLICCICPLVLLAACDYPELLAPKAVAPPVLTSPLVATPGFSLSASPRTLSIDHGSSNSTVVAIDPGAGFTGNVNLSTGGLPTGIVAVFSPEVTGKQSTLTLTVTDNAAPGVFTIKLSGTTASTQANTTLTVTVPEPSFSLSVSPSTLSIDQWASNSSVITISPQNGFIGNVNLSTGGLPTGIVAVFSPEVTGKQSTLTLTATDSAAPGIFTIKLGGTTADTQANAALTVTVPVASALRSSGAYCNGDGYWTGPRFDRFAEAPRTCFPTDLADTQGSGKTYLVQLGGDIVSALSSAECGDTVELQKGASFLISSLTLTPKNCSDTDWITVRTSAPDSDLPPEHTRINPSYAGVSTLPGRPPFTGGSGNAMAQIVLRKSTDILVPGDHFRFIGIEITRQADGKWHNALIHTLTTKVIFDRCWVHGDPLAETGHLVQIAPSSDHIAVIDSYLSDAHCTAVTGVCSDAQDITATGGGQTIKILDNFLEASGESIMFGGGSASVLTADVEIRLNHFFKPLIWNPIDLSFIGTSFIVKNNLELKEGQRIFVEGNTLENTWGGFSQNGSNILLTPKNQSGANGMNLCPICLLSDVTLRYNYVRHGATALIVGDGESDNHGWSAGSSNYSIHDMIFDGMQYAECYGCGYFLTEIGSGYDPKNPPPTTLHNVSIDHITIVNLPFLAPDDTASGLMEMGGPPANNPTSTAQIMNVSWTNSIAPTGRWATFSTGGGANNCASIKGDDPIIRIAACWVGIGFFTGNVLDADGEYKTFVWPAGNQIAQDWASIGFVNFNAGDAGDYRLSSSSSYKGSALDGLDPGANVDAVMAPVVWVQ